MITDQFETIETPRSTKMISIGALLSAIYAVMVAIPISAFIGAGSILSGAIFIAPLFGIILGPRYGFVFGLIGGILATFVSIFFGGLYLAIPTIIFGPAISGFLLGICVRKQDLIESSRIPGPIITAFYLGLVIILYLIPNNATWWFILPYTLALFLAIGLQFMKIDLKESSMKRLPIHILFLTFIGTMLDFSMMTLGSVYLLNLPADLFGFVIFPIMLIERTAATIISAIIAVVVLASFRDIL